LGPPDRLWSTNSSFKCYAWPTPLGEVCVVHYEEPWDGWSAPPEDWEQRNDRWMLTAMPNALPIETLLHPSLIEPWQRLPENGELILTPFIFPSVRVRKEGGRLTSIRWHAPGGW
ncbi:MAG: hypothetical protein AAF492_14520, partial [Verrucomicrobiota bacterium]